MSIEENKKLVEEFLRCFGKKQVQKALDMMSEDAIWWIGGKSDLFPLAGEKTKSEMGDLLNDLVLSMKNGLEITPLSYVVEGNKVAVEAKSFGEFPDGRIYNNEYHFLIEIRHGKISRIKEYLDTMHIASVLGML